MMKTIIVVALLALASQVLGNSNPGQGAVCAGPFGGGGPHGAGGPTPAFTLPTTAAAGSTTPITITLTATGGAAFTGHSLAASAGTMTAGANSKSSCAGKGVVHTAGGQKTSITATWTPPATAPAGGTVTFYATLVNGGYGNLQKTLTVTGGGAAPTPTPPAPKPPGPSPTPTPTPTDPGDESSSPETSDSTDEPAPATATIPDLKMEIKLQVDLATYDPKSPQDFRDTWDPEFTADLATLLEFPDDSRIEVYKFEPQFTKTKTKTKGPVLVGFKIANEGQDTPLPGADLVEKFESIKAGDAQGTLLTTTSVTSYTLITDTKNAPSSPSSGMSSTAVIAIVCVVIGCVLAIAGYFYWRSHKRGSKTQFKSDVATISSAPAATMTSTDGWSKVWDENTKHYYYFNSKTSESRWTPPPGVTF